VRSVTFESCLNGVASTAGIDPSNLLAHEKILLTEYINDAVRFCYDYYPWAEFTLTEKRYFRDEYLTTKTYAVDDEVFYKDQYYRCWTSSTNNLPDTSVGYWHEIGDLSNNPEWSENGLYDIGAKVSYNEKDYLCISIPNTASGIPLANYQYDGINPSNVAYFQELTDQFERYIAYEQIGKNPIETIISIHRSDPRYSNTKPLNFREGTEGIYVESTDAVINEVWLKYRIDAPTYTTSSLTEPVAKFLYPTIKLHAYKSWLVGDGQHEKSELWEIKVLDTLVREVDKLDQQQDRGQPYVIRGNAYRRTNATQPYTQEQTLDEIGAIKEGLPDSNFKIGASARGFNPVRFGSSALTSRFTNTCVGKNAIKTAGKWVTGGSARQGGFIKFFGSMIHPTGTGIFPANSIFKITLFDGLDIEYNMIYTQIGGVNDGLTQNQLGGFRVTDPMYQKGIYWDAYSRDDISSSSRIGVVANGRNIMISIGNARFDGEPLVGRFFVAKVPILLADGNTLPVGRYQIVSQNAGAFQISY
jgi:hypothetical protein